MITFEINGTEFINVKKAEASDSIDEFAGSFSFTTHKKIGAAVDDLCIVKVDGEKFITGYIDSAEIDYSEDSHNVTFSGRAKTQDVIDSTIGNKVTITGAVTLKDAIQIVLDDISSTLKIIDNANTDKFEKFDKISGDIGDNAFELISKYCRKRQVLLSSNEDGDIVLSKGKTKDSGLSINSKDETGNIKKANFISSHANRFNRYQVFSQSNTSGFNFTGETSAKKLASNDGIVSDKEIRSSRVMSVVAETSSTDEDCEKRADWMARVNRSRSITYRATVANHNQDGMVWKKGYLVNIDDDFSFNKPVKMLIKKLTFSMGDETTTSLEFAPEDTYENLISEPVKIEKDATFSF
ncbi:MAG: hypothetical protein OEM38_00510 [Gammaproteobacteria bacterium]|nr:hypothetical protein [Gammaproteobacteria bacterium]